MNLDAIKTVINYCNTALKIFKINLVFSQEQQLSGNCVLIGRITGGSIEKKIRSATKESASKWYPKKSFKWEQINKPATIIHNRLMKMKNNNNDNEKPRTKQNLMTFKGSNPENIIIK